MHSINGTEYPEVVVMADGARAVTPPPQLGSFQSIDLGSPGKFLSSPRRHGQVELELDTIENRQDAMSN